MRFEPKAVYSLLRYHGDTEGMEDIQVTALRKILYVEDEPDIQAVAVLALETVGGLTVKACSSGTEALREAVAFAPDLILLDVMMPGMNGPDALLALRQQPSLANVPAIFMTAKVQPDELEEYKRLGALGTIAKPFDPMTLAEQVRELWTTAHDG